MREYLLKRALPFALTFAVGAAVGGFFQLLGLRGHSPRAGRYFESYEGRRGCGKRFRRNYFAPETKAPVILFKPDARLPPGTGPFGSGTGPSAVRVRVTFGEDGKVRWAGALDDWSGELSEVGRTAERAARQIQFIPATAGGAPTTVTQEVEIRFSF